jgi:uncharacterized protein
MLTMVDTERKWREWASESIERLRRYKELGYVGFIGLSTHSASMAVTAARSGLIDVIMYPLNLTSHALEQDMAVCQACADRGVGLVAMKPYGGGTLLAANGKQTGVTPVQCLAYVLSLPVSTTVPGPRNAREFLSTLHYLEASDEEKAFHPILARVQRSLTGPQCTRCDHCQPCPQDIDVSTIVNLVGWAGYAEEGTDERIEAFTSYAALPVRASACTECAVCIERCPFGVDVIAKMRKAVETFEGTAVARAPGA